MPYIHCILYSLQQLPMQGNTILNLKFVKLTLRQVKIFAQGQGQ